MTSQFLNDKKYNVSTSTGSSNRFRFCMLCRGDDSPFIKCENCKKPYHFECANLRSDEIYEADTNCIRKDWSCPDCIDTKDKKIVISDEVKQAKKEFAIRASINKDSIAKILNSRKKFLNDKRVFLEPFCDSLILDKLSSNAGPMDEEYQSKASKISNGKLRETPKFIKAELRDYQLIGYNTMLEWYLRGVGGILADEMGLGKTIQTITLLATLKNELNLSGPHLVIAPLAVLQNWANEINVQSTGDEQHF